MISSEFRKEEYWLIKWPLAGLVFCLLVAVGLLVGLNAVDSTATQQLRRARADLDSARQMLEDIEEEEATIIEYIGRYRQMDQDGVVSAEDRLQFQETVGELRTRYNLFPVNLNIGGQTSLPLEYPDGRTEAGTEVILHTSLVEFSLPLLHEDDLARLLGSLMEGAGLLQPLACSVSANSGTTNFVYLAQHFTAACSMHWYTFELPPAAEESD